MQQYQEDFNALLGVKPEPNEHELVLFERAKKYIQKLTWIPGIEMIAVSNSLSMYATHADSDIDLFIVTRPNMVWFVRFFVTLIFRLLGVWRHGKDISGNFCLSFFITTEAMNLEKIAIENDIYLYYWIYYLKPIFEVDNTYTKFLEENSWVNVPEEQKKKNLKFRIDGDLFPDVSIPLGGGTQGGFVSEEISLSPPTPPHRGTSKGISYRILNKLIRFFLLPRTQRSYHKLEKPWGVIISDTMLKFHPEDRRKEVCDAIVEKNFDK